MGTNDQRPPHDNESPDRDDTAPNETVSVERYRRAHEVIERMRADLRPDRSGAHDDDPRLDATAALLRAAAPHAADVDPGFAARLLAQLEATQAATQAATQDSAPDAPQPQPREEPAASPSARPSGVSRRGLMLGGLGAAAAAVIGGAAGTAIGRASQGTAQGQGPSVTPQGVLIPDGVGSWIAVAHVADVPVGAVRRFQTDAVIGYLRHAAEGFIALSGVCTHMACLLQWNGVDRTFDCPCHGSRFLETGKQAPGAPYPYPPLPGIKTKVENGQVWVYVISPSGSAPASASPTATSNPGGQEGYNR
ncbi:MAG TPA: Rieske (2Fe-2S) protein [Ktedonobacterales bacterium]|nr:Rieske (2Fe-2S) protein [Ktedonobacterales bacterium]